MSTITVHFPDCATKSSDQADVITIETEGCPADAPEPAPMISTFSVIVIGIVLLAFFASVAIVRYRAHELKPERLQARNAARKIELDAEVAMAALHTKCDTCGEPYKPELREA